MKREILCSTCAARRLPSHPDDIAAGYVSRRVEIKAKVPPNHGLTINGQFHPMEAIRCDLCNEVLTDGTPAVALTTWNQNRESEPRLWEQEYSL